MGSAWERDWHSCILHCVAEYFNFSFAFIYGIIKLFINFGQCQRNNQTVINLLCLLYETPVFVVVVVCLFVCLFVFFTHLFMFGGMELNAQIKEVT